MKGADWKGRLPEQQVRICREHGVEIVYLDTVRGSSSRLPDSYVRRTGAR